MEQQIKVNDIGLSISLVDLDVLRRRSSLISDGGWTEIIEFNKWRDSLGVPEFPTLEERSGVMAEMWEAQSTLDALAATLTFRVAQVDREELPALVRVLTELDRVLPFPEAELPGSRLRFSTRLGLFALMTGAVRYAEPDEGLSHD